MPLYTCQLWCKSTYSSINCMDTACNDAYHVLHYILKNVSVHPHELSLFHQNICYLDKKQFHAFFQQCRFSSNFLPSHFSCLIPFINLLFYPSVWCFCIGITECSSYRCIVSVHKFVIINILKQHTRNYCIRSSYKRRMQWKKIEICKTHHRIEMNG